MTSPFQALQRWIPAGSMLFVSATLLLNCEGEELAPALLESGGEERPPVVVDECAISKTGCPCEAPDQKLECGTIKEQRGDYVICRRGFRTCVENQWSECLPEGAPIEE